MGSAVPVALPSLGDWSFSQGIHKVLNLASSSTRILQEPGDDQLIQIVRMGQCIHSVPRWVVLPLWPYPC